MDEAKMAEAWAEFDKAVRFEAKSTQPELADGAKRIAARAADKALDKAVALEAEAVGS